MKQLVSMPGYFLDIVFYTIGIVGIIALSQTDVLAKIVRSPMLNLMVEISDLQHMEGS